jgi:hypothetical protein
MRADFWWPNLDNIERVFYNLLMVGYEWPELNLDKFARGFVLGLLVGEGYFGGTGRYPQVTLRMHVRHARLLEWMATAFPGSKTYGPYHHQGRHYMQWVARASVLHNLVVPLVGRNIDYIDDHVARRFQQMCDDYGLWWDPEEPDGILTLPKTPIVRPR